jgi:hypothetical protein
MISTQMVYCGPDSRGYEYAAQTLRSLSPTIERNGVVSAKEITIDTLADRLREDAVTRQAVLFAPRLVSAWANVTQ